MSSNARLLSGVVVSDKADKTITVKVERKVKHPKYGKIIKRSTKIHAHDESNSAKMGDVVTVQECKPYSKNKTWLLIDSAIAGNDKAVEAEEPGMLHHTFDQDPDDPLRFVWSEVYKNDDALLAHLANPAVGIYLEAHAELGTDFSVEFYGTVGDKVIEAMNGTGVPYKIFKTKLGYSRV